MYRYTIRFPPCPYLPGVAERVKHPFPELLVEVVVAFVPGHDEPVRVLVVHLCIISKGCEKNGTYVR